MNPLLEIKVPTNRCAGNTRSPSAMRADRACGPAPPLNPLHPQLHSPHEPTSGNQSSYQLEIKVPTNSVRGPSDSPTVTTSSGAGEEAEHTYHFRGRDVEHVGKIALIGVLLRVKAAAEERVRHSNIVSLSDLQDETQPGAEESGITRDKAEAKQPSSPKGITRFMPEKLRRAAAIALGGFTLGGAVPKGDGAIFDSMELRAVGQQILEETPSLQPTGYFQLEGVFTGSGVLIAPNLVLTAAHGMTEELIARIPREAVFGTGPNYLTDPGTQLRILHAIPYKLNPKIGRDPDFMILVLAENVTDMPIAVIAETPTQVGDDIAVVGFGRYGTTRDMVDGAKDALWDVVIDNFLADVPENYLLISATDNKVPAEDAPTGQSAPGGSGGFGGKKNQFSEVYELSAVVSGVWRGYTFLSIITSEVKTWISQVKEAYPASQLALRRNVPILSFTFDEARNPQIEFEAAEGFSYSLLKSTDLKDWHEVGILQNISGRTLFLDLSEKATKGLYRILETPLSNEDSDL